MITSAEVVAEARTWLGVPYLHQGRSRRGVDCIGFIICVASALDLLPRNFRAPTNYGRRGDGRLLAGIQAYCTPANVARAGCLVALRWPREREATHVGLLTETSLIQCYQHVGCVVEHGYRAQWVRMTDGLWHLPGVAYE